ncbi:MAG TPA: hypothetical protein VFP84_22275 [Kofleriaceae bacterium]|nr:hypothetical protein [Kofleriaceae bacterium]
MSTSAVGPAAAAARPAREPTSLDSSSEDGDSCDDDDIDFDASVPIDREHLDARDAAATLGRTLALALDPISGMRRLSATHLAATWSLSDDPLRRLAVAHALEWSFPLVGDALVIDHLSRDREPGIRAAAARAAWARRHTGGDLGVLARLSHDPDPTVRAVAGSARA